MESAYMDHASATPVRKEVLEAMLPYFRQYYANPSNVYEIGSKIKQVMENQRARVADLIGAKPEEIKMMTTRPPARPIPLSLLTVDMETGAPSG